MQQSSNSSSVGAVCVWVLNREVVVVSRRRHQEHVKRLEPNSSSGLCAGLRICNQTIVDLQRSHAMVSACRCKPIAFVISSLVEEGLAICAAMEHAAILQLENVIFESDLLQLIAWIISGHSFSDLHGILSDISLLSLSFNHVPFRFVHRNNLVFEDGLAKHALNGYVTNPV
ncbi:hypothetical protein Bca52824_038896 [Brassica carinata]|uniref:RNase H type-1 domain-containing protein n=1 Tax=Brassica carinata TaxID=52824 RepID=A0A8X7RQD5_BRACI|nr:hypothetical protein Bca52824_038896 [Brassica carinata]